MPVIANVPTFKQEPDAGNLALLALQAALNVAGQPVSLIQLAGASGDAFKFLYDNAPVRQPLRDLRPWDSLAAACAVCGLHAEWITDATPDSLRDIVADRSQLNQPILTSGLPDQNDVTCALLVGYETVTDTLHVRSAAPTPNIDTPYQTLNLNATPPWHGPITGSPHWANVPLFVLRGALDHPPDENQQRRGALERALAALEGEPVAYPDHTGAHQYATIPLAGRTVRQGWVAFDYLRQDLAEADLSAADTLWRINAQLAQLAWDRELAAHYLTSWGRTAPAGLVARYRTIAHTARSLLSRNWETRSLTLTTPASLTDFITGTAAYLYALPANAKLQAATADLGQRIDTQRGPALLVDTPQRRAGAVQLAQRLLDLERGNKPLLEQALNAV